MAKQVKKETVVRMNPRLRRILIPLAVLIPLVAVLSVLCLTARREPLTTKEMLDKQEWRPNELQDALSRCFQLHGVQNQRPEVMKHLREHLKKLSPEEQERIRIAATVDAMNRNLEQLRVLTPEERNRVISEMNQRAENSLQRIKKMSQSQKEKYRERLTTTESKAVSTEMNKIFVGKMTPEERRDFYPLTEKWMKIMKEL